MKSNGSDKTSQLFVCPICESPFDRAECNTMPFCSSRCRQVDLGRWLGESYGLPYESEDQPEEFNLEDELEFDDI